MTKFKVKEDCLCEHYVHEISYYPRAGLVKKELKKDDEVEFKEKWNNFYGSFIRVTKGDEYYDIPQHKLEEIK